MRRIPHQQGEQNRGPVYEWRSHIKLHHREPLLVCPLLHSCIGMFLFQCHEQGCSKSGSAPDGTPYLEAAEKEDMKALLR